MVTGFVKLLLRAEGLALFLAALVAYHILDGSWWMFAALILVPDLSFIGFVLGPKIGSIAYNALHSTIGPLLLGSIGWLVDHDNTIHIFRDICSLTALIWLAHIGFDRAVGYGLKYASAFKDTHLGQIGKT
jgi:Domain of unknown function (DUF4260)